MEFDKVRNALNDLINNNQDARDGFKELALAAEHTGVKKLMTKYAEDRQKFVEVLKAELENLGGKPKNKFNILDDLHRAWIDIKVNNSNDTIEAIIEECERGENIAIEDYEDIIENIDMPSSTHEILMAQLTVIQNRLKELIELKNIHEAEQERD